ncbi:class I histocompatibility antigen, F10 alpha chain-like isoform X3 [Anser cygnoides]|uniref:class I histocompatibility antigen, F10 alpha chain-like isoform X3 n=1 Tax=Anser cygnoides TaxID=8845 RepID=UPI0034D3764F
MPSSSRGGLGQSGAMGPGRAGGLGLEIGWGLLLLLGVLGGAASGPHSLHYFYTGVSDPSPGMWQFVAVGYVDGEVFVRYDSKTQRTDAMVDWMLAIDDQQYWDRNTRNFQNSEQVFRVGLDILQERYNQSRGSHTLQWMYGCDFLEDSSITGFDQLGYDGKDFIALDKDTLTYTAADAGAQVTKRKWEEEGTSAERKKHYLENTCIEWLRKYVSYGKAVLDRREHPEVRVSGMEVDRILTLSCRAHGFYPRPISISWLKDGVVQEQETQRGRTLPNSDGTYHAWATIDVLLGDKDKYQCRVEHASLPQPGLFSWEPQSNLIHIMAEVAVVAVIAALVGFAVWKCKQGRMRRAITWHQAAMGDPAAQTQGATPVSNGSTSAREGPAGPMCTLCCSWMWPRSPNLSHLLSATARATPQHNCICTPSNKINSPMIF